MELRTVEKLLQKYFEAETSIAEENILREYFASTDVAPHLEHYRPLFGYFETEANKTFEKDLPLKPRKRNVVGWISVAASVVLLSGLFFITNNQSAPADELGTYEDPEVAFRETQKALNMLSNTVNVGVSGVEYLNEYEQSKQKVFKDNLK
ncbi:hypothetical protein GCM10007424_12510 [Flavobacterium suaedae]|uniref:DUF3379 family protein n=1 Tax=Flavobacterium suaedae TaxID=1767027 RepID=A0ABQ1JT92_9FLAO|nr:hypothetical protein [Flavobacterium suaedae]GGB74101.1 hypothetical protein GCM10007424_12510 [Flavobacterium suaedae]